jgi:hypothetical protein
MQRVGDLNLFDASILLLIAGNDVPRRGGRIRRLAYRMVRLGLAERDGGGFRLTDEGAAIVARVRVAGMRMLGVLRRAGVGR